MEPYRLSANRLAILLNVSPTCVTEIVRGKREITTNTAVKLGRCFSTTAEFWLNLQQQYNLELAADEGLFEKVNRTVTVFKPTHA